MKCFWGWLVVSCIIYWYVLKDRNEYVHVVPPWTTINPKACCSTVAQCLMTQNKTVPLFLNLVPALVGHYSALCQRPAVNLVPCQNTNFPTNNWNLSHRELLKELTLFWVLCNPGKNDRGGCNIWRGKWTVSGYWLGLFPIGKKTWFETICVQNFAYKT